MENLTYISTQTASASAQLDFTTGIDATYRSYRFVISNLLLSNTASLRMKLSTDGLGTFVTMGQHFVTYKQSVTAPPVIIGVNSDEVSVCSLGTTNLTANGFVDMFYPESSTIQTILNFKFSGGSNSDTRSNFGSVEDNTRQTVNSARFLPSAGTFTSGTIILYGVS
jgi:hypothetical protein